MELACAHHGSRPARARCVACGAHLCAGCRAKVGGRNWCRPCVPESLRRHLPGRRSPVAAALLSAVPGLGQIYVGRLGRGVVFLAAAAAVAAQDASVPAPVPLFLWIFNMFDALVLAHERNAGITGLPLERSAAVQRRFWGAFGTGVAAFAVARATVVPELDPDLLWPGALALYGLFLLFDRRREPDVRTA